MSRSPAITTNVMIRTDVDNEGMELNIHKIDNIKVTLQHEGNYWINFVLLESIRCSGMVFTRLLSSMSYK